MSTSTYASGFSLLRIASASRVRSIRIGNTTSLRDAPLRVTKITPLLSGRRGTTRSIDAVTSCESMNELCFEIL